MILKWQKNSYQVYPIILPLLALVFLTFLALSQLAAKQPVLYIGITYDLMLVVPLLHLFLTRNRKTPKITAAPFLVLGTTIAAFVLPQEHQQHYQLLRTYLLPVVELGVLGTVFYYVYQTASHISKGKKKYVDKYLLIQDSTVRALNIPKLAKIVAAEAALFYYALFSWKKRPLQANEYTYHKKNGTVALLAVVILIVLIETFAVHLLLIQWNIIVAWVLFGLSLYGAIMLFAQIKAILKRPHQLTTEQLILKNGVLGTAYIPYRAIKKIQIIEQSSDLPDKKNSPFHRWATLGELESPNVLIHFEEKHEIELMYGFNKQTKIIALAVDQEVEFVKQVLQKI